MFKKRKRDCNPAMVVGKKPGWLLSRDLLGLVGGVVWNEDSVQSFVESVSGSL